MRQELNIITFTLFTGFLAVCILLTVNITSSIAAESGIKIMQKEKLGKFLATEDGMTLYSYSRDNKNVSNCIEGCALNWPPYYADLTSPVEGFEAGDFAVMNREDGRRQTTFKGMPLYRFINDRYPGDTFGNGIGDVWSIVRP